MSFTSQFTKYNFPLFGLVRLPEIKITEEEKKSVGAPEEISNVDFLKLIIKKGFTVKIKSGYIPKEKVKEYTDRTRKEYDAFVELGFTDYILLVWRVCNFCETNNIMTDYGRGSCAGSLCFFFIGVTHIDSIKHGLFFERFISKTRAKKTEINGITYIDGSLAPDVDLDVDPQKRHLVISFLDSLYPNRMCKILNASELSGKILIKECGKIVGDKTDSEMTDVTELIPKIFGIVHDLEKAYEEAPEFKRWCDQNKRIYNIALKLRHLYKNFSVHASGYVVSYDPLLDIMPTQLDSNGDLVSSYTKDDAGSLTIKLDILGSRCSTVVHDTCKQLNLNWRDLDVEHDAAVYDNLSQGLKHFHGVFQLEAHTNMRVAQDIKPKNLSELSDVVAIARPGALSFLKTYLENKCEKIHPIFDEILKETRGVCLYQEQMMKMSHAIGFTLEEAEILRRIVGKKKVHEVKEWKDKIYAKCKENNHPIELGDLLWKILDDSSKYSFNKSHSVAFASLSALTIYLKYKYPLQFFTALLNQAKNEMDSLNEIYLIQSELPDFGIKLLPPSLEYSDMDFSIEDNKNIRYGLGCLKGVSGKTIEKLLSFKKKYNNRFEIFEAAEQSKINIGVLSSLIQAGCIDPSPERSSLVYEAQLYRLLTKKEKVIVHSLVKEMSGDLRDIIQYMIKTKDGKGKPLIKESRVETLKKKAKKYKEIFEQNKKNERLAIYYYELKNIGYPYTYSLKSIDPEYENTFQNISEIKRNFDPNEQVRGLFELSEVYKGRGRKSGNTYVKFSLRDETGTIDGLAFNSERAQTVDWIQEDNGGKLPAKGEIVFIKGKKKDDASLYLDKCDVQTYKIYTKLSELKNSSDENEDSVEKTQ